MPPAWEAVKKSVVSGKTLYDDLKTIPIYANHRESLRPWDRKLPAIVDQEANRRAMWIIRPPSGYVIAGVLLGCILALECIAIVPFAVNFEYIYVTWRDIEKPNVVYQDPRVLLSVSLVVHMCSGMSLWFMFLSEGFSKHQAELVPFCLAVLLECIWMDVAFYLGRLDWTLMIWVSIFVLTIISMVLLVVKDVIIAAIFFLPQLAASLTVMIYTIEFIKLHSAELNRAV